MTQHTLSYPTVSNRFHLRETDWRDRREQATPVLNKILDELNKQYKWTQQRIFLSKCRDQNVTPKGLKVKIPKGIMSKDQETKFKRKCELDLIRKTIRRLHAKQQNSDERLAGLKLELRNKFRMSRNWIENTWKWLQKKAIEKSKSNKKSLRTKFDKLLQEKQLLKDLLLEEEKNKQMSRPDAQNPMRKVVYNNSGKKLSAKQEQILELGLNFAITPKKFPLLEYIAAAEDLCQSLEGFGDDESVEKAQKIRNVMIDHIKKGVGLKIKDNLSADEKKIVKEIVSDPSIIICPADKGKAIVIEDRESYLSKMQQQLDEGDYKIDNRKEKTLLDKLHKKLINQLRSMDIDIDDFKEKRKYLVSAPMLGHMYLLIKVHKKNFPGRAVVSQVNDPTYKVCKILTDILNPLAVSGQSHIENSYELKKFLQELRIDPHDIQASFDVVALYPSIPIPKALECVRRRLLSDSTLSERTDWNPDDIMKLLEICLETHFKTIDGNIYTQLDGTPIGKSISGPIADIFMIWFEEEFVFNADNEFQPHLKAWKRYRDDIYIFWSGGSETLDCFFWQLNYKHPKIEFTIERERNGILPFLDLSIQRLPDKLITKVYRKETHTQRYAHWRSNLSKNCKLGILKGLIHRAHLFCDLKEDLLDELQLLRDVFISNGYPKKLVDRAINNSWKIELKKQIDASFYDENNQDIDKPEENPGYYDTINVPYIAGFSEKLAKDLKLINIGVTFRKGKTLYNSFCKLKPPCTKEMRKNVIYCLGCKSCPQIYLGETQQWFPSRKYQHEYAVRKQSSTNGIAQHVVKTDHEIDWESAKFLDSDPHWRKRKIKEALFIDCLNPQKQISNALMNLEKGLDIPDCWKEFNSDIRKIFFKKVPSTK